MAEATSFETPFPWTCPYCGRDTTIVSVSDIHGTVWGPGKSVLYAYVYTFRCPNDTCTRSQLTFQIFKAIPPPRGGGFGYSVGEFIREWTLIPASSAKAFPDYVPEPIRETTNRRVL